MHKNNIAYLVALTMLAATTVPMTSADPGTFDHFEDTQAPVGLVSKDFGNTALAVCFLNETMPASCDPQPGAIPALGGAFFIVDGNDTAISDWNKEPEANLDLHPSTYGRHVRINVEQTAGQTLGGFAAYACTDFNDDIECDSGSFGFADDDCTSGKDEKDCADPTDLELDFCAERDDYPYLLVNATTQQVTEEYDDTWDDFVVFVEAWADIADDDAGGLDLFDNENDNTGFGATVGQFRVHADWNGQTGFKNQADCNALNDIVITHPLPECSDGVDNDGDGWVDSEDGGCYNGIGDYDPRNDSEAGETKLGTECDNGVDDDGDLDADGNDTDCNNRMDNDESV